MTRRRTSRDDLTGELPGAPCRICGAWVRPGEGTSLPASGALPRSSYSAHPVRFDHREQWLRQHDHCKASLGAVVARLVGEKEPLSKTLAARTLEHADVEAVTAFQRDLEEPARVPFGFVSAVDRRALKQALITVRAEMGSEPDGTPRRCNDGACGLCGRSQSPRWWQSPITWTDGSAAPFCDNCVTEWERAQSPKDTEKLREVAEAVMSGIPRQLGGVHHGMRFYAETAKDDHAGLPEPWRYSPDALTEVRRRAWKARPHLIPDDEFRRRYVARARRLAKERAADAEQSRRNEEEGADIDWS